MKHLLQKVLQKKQGRDASKLTAWMHDLSAIDDVAALTLSTQQLALLIDSEELSIKHKLDLIFELEEINQPRLETLSQQFANLANLKPELEKSLSETSYTYSRQSYVFHLKLIEEVLNPAIQAPEPDVALLLLARAMNAAFNMLKWRAFLQQNQPTKIWLQTYLLYKIANRLDLLNTPIELFPLYPATTLSAFITQLCMFGQLEQASLEKQHFQVAEKILRIWLTHAHISQNHNAEQYVFYIDLNKDVAAKRMRHFTPNEHCRYWELDDLEKQIAIAITVSARGEFPDSLILSKINDPAILNETLTVLHAEWTKNEYVRQRREDDREATSEQVKVKAGITEISNQVLNANQLNSGLKLSKDGNSFNDLMVTQSALNRSNALGVNSSSLDTWIITDKSKRGLGCRVNKYANTLPRPKKLIGIVYDDDPTKVSIGIIRTVRPTQGTQLRVGIELFSNLAIWVQLKPLQDKSSQQESGNDLLTTDTNRQSSNMFAGIFMPQEPELTTQASIILPKLDFRPNIKYTIFINGKTKHYEFDEPMESHNDWIRFPIDF